MPCDLPRLGAPLALRCEACGETDEYSVGTIVVDPDRLRGSAGSLPKDGLQFSGYFRYTRCDAPGPWEIPPESVMRIITLLVERHRLGIPNGVVLGEIRTFDGHRFMCAAQGEAHLKALIDREPQRGDLWIRLGNLYGHSGRPDLALPAYKRAFQLDLADLEMRTGLAAALVQLDRADEAVPHWQFVIANARHAERLEIEVRRRMVTAAVDGILAVHSGSGLQVDFLPPDHSPQGGKPSDGPVDVELFQLDLSRREDFETLVDHFLGMQTGRFAARRSSAARASRFAGGFVSPNGPCPCGSGRKHKNCCARVGRR